MAPNPRRHTLRHQAIARVLNLSPTPIRISSTCPSKTPAASCCPAIRATCSASRAPSPCSPATASGSAWPAASTGRCATSSPRRPTAPCWWSPTASTPSATRWSGRGSADQFHPSYTRMVPAHHVTELAARRLPRPQPDLPALLRPAARTSCRPTSTPSARPTSAPCCDEIRLWLAAAARDGARWASASPAASTAARVLLCLYHALLACGESPARLKAFTLAVDGGGDDLRRPAHSSRRARPRVLLRGRSRSQGSEIDPCAAVARHRGLQAARRASARPMSLALLARDPRALPRVASTWSTATAATRTSRTTPSRRTPS